MSTEQEVKFDFSSQLKPLEEEFNKDTPDIDKFKEAYRSLNQTRLELQHMVEMVADGKRDNRDFKRLRANIAGENATQLLERLRAAGYRLMKELASREEDKNAFQRQGYRLLEQTRAGKRDDVYYVILRIFFSLQKEFPPELVEAFKPVYSDEMFKVFLFSFLSGVLGQRDENE